MPISSICEMLILCPYSVKVFLSAWTIAEGAVLERSREPVAKNSSVNFLASILAMPVSHSSISRSARAVVGDVRFSVSERIPAHRQIATACEGSASRW